MPTMMSAWPSRAISSRMAGVSVDPGIRLTLSPSNGAGSAWGGGLGDADGRVGSPGDGPVLVLLARRVAGVRAPVREVAEAERAPRHERQHRRGPHDRADPDEERLLEDPLEDASALEQGHL